jgi:hypothetical protein
VVPTPGKLVAAARIAPSVVNTALECGVDPEEAALEATA